MNEKYMNFAIKEAQKAMEIGEIPVGCVIVKNDKIISKTHNLKELKQCCLYHAEISAIKKASKKIKNWRLDGCSIYVTLEPCPMCASAIRQSRIDTIYYLIDNEKNSLTKTILNNYDINKPVEIIKLDFPNSYEQMLRKFFSDKRSS